MRPWWIVLAWLTLFGAGCGTSPPSAEFAQTLQKRAGPPGPAARVLIAGVPFISWGEARRLDYQDKDILNPSFAASLGMLLQFWGQDLALLKRIDDALPSQPGGWGVVESGTAKSLEDLKPYIARGLPVLVSLALTPVAHPLDPLRFAMASQRGFKFPDGGLHSGILGRMVPLATFQELGDLLKIGPVESLFVAARLIIGYDDEKGVLILHDPTFGPAFEIHYDRFEMMWAGPWKRFYLIPHPSDSSGSPQNRPPAPAYPPRTPDQQAAAQFVLGYAHSSIGRVAAGEQFLRAGLATPGVGKHYQHLLLFELALHAQARGHRDEAIGLARRAIELLPEHSRPWQFIGEIHKSSPWGLSEKEGSEAEAKAEALCADPKAQQTVAESLGRDFLIFSGCPIQRR